ncbi:hypothetical protein L873DRAFT_1029384 [Choiromyces venosus 120613-1]|uniref:Uncharacterized protein n=1 Tax=Choiromyces venosus 120613-1 TaxID=1336337 RepID=A0A3N4JNE3_9PEZI|nr:hypothetical protein L873DRAFT_1029384 [Choiromyces venosus 120613-1]
MTELKKLRKTLRMPPSDRDKGLMCPTQLQYPLKLRNVFFSFFAFDSNILCLVTPFIYEIVTKTTGLKFSEVLRIIEVSYFPPGAFD